MTDTTALVPEWIPTQDGRQYEVSFTDADGRQHDWHVFLDNFDGTGRRRNMAWHAWPNVPDWDRWDRPVWLHRRIGDARDEFLVRIVHGWQRGYGFADGGAGDAIYGRDGIRRERRFIVAELTGRGICARCGKSVHVRVDGTLNAHRRPRSLDRCGGTHQEPAVEPETFACLGTEAS